MEVKGTCFGEFLSVLPATIMLSSVLAVHSGITGSMVVVPGYIFLQLLVEEEGERL